MKKTLIFILAIMLANNLYCQSIQDYRDFLKERIEASPALVNYNNHVAFGNEIFKIDAELFTGHKLTDSEYSNIFFYVNDIFQNELKKNLMVEVIRCCDIMGINKVSAYKDHHKNIEFFTIKIYMKPEYLCTTYSERSGASNDNSIEIKVKCDSDAASNIKKAIIKLAQLSGNKDVYDGDSLF